MAFTPATLSKVSGGIGSGPSVFVYLSPDAHGDVGGTDYFALGSKNYGMALGDVVISVFTTGYLATVHAVSAIDSDGNATVSAAVLA